MLKKILAILLVIASCAALAGCGGTEEKSSTNESESETLNGPDVADDPLLVSEAEYLKKYADCERAEAWIRKNILDADCPPVNFVVGIKNSNSFTWTKTVSETTTVTDYKDVRPVERSFYTVTFDCAEYGIAVEVTVTTYPGFPVVEYSSVLVNKNDGNSEEIKNLNSVCGNIYETSSDMDIRYYTGSCTDANGENDYKEFIKEMKYGAKDAQLTLEVDNGKPTSTYLPDFNIENENGDGVIAILSWQGCWKANFAFDNDGLTMKAGQRNTDFCLLEGETHRFPSVVLIYYKTGHMYGQNIYRRWFWNHNFMRAEGEQYGPNVLVSTGNATGEEMLDVQSTAKLDKLALRGVKSYDFQKYVDRYCQDAGWNDYGSTKSWFTANGNWDVDTARYPNGLKEISDTAAELGLGFTLWVEPERVVKASTLSEEHPEYVIYYTDNNGSLRYAENGRGVQKNANGLVNLGDKEACDYIIDMLDKIITENGVSSYRQDFNFYPADYWMVYDQYEATQLKIKRTGRTEEQYCNGYLRMFDTLLERHPGLTIDACASGGMRYDLDTARRAYCHTRTDWFGDANKAQSDTYVTAKWLVYWGGTLDISSAYTLRSRLSADVGIGIMAATSSYDYKSYYQNLGRGITEWRDLNSYMFEDYYPLTKYVGMYDTDPIGMQYDCPSKKAGMAVVFMRNENQSGSVALYGLDENANYKWYNFDKPDEVFTSTGKDLMTLGLSYSAEEGNAGYNNDGTPTAVITYIYELAE